MGHHPAVSGPMSELLWKRALNGRQELHDDTIYPCQAFITIQIGDDEFDAINDAFFSMTSGFIQWA